eukprot:PhM_4_TR2045/c3_g1_i1/m.95493
MKNISVVGGAPLVSLDCGNTRSGVSIREGVIRNITLDGTSVVKFSNTHSNVCRLEFDGVYMKDIHMTNGTEWCSVVPLKDVQFVLNNARFDLDDQGGVAAVAYITDNDHKSSVVAENVTLTYKYSS